MINKWNPIALPEIRFVRLLDQTCNATTWSNFKYDLLSDWCWEKYTSIIWDGQEVANSKYNWLHVQNWIGAMAGMTLLWLYRVYAVTCGILGHRNSEGNEKLQSRCNAVPIRRIDFLNQIRPSPWGASQLLLRGLNKTSPKLKMNWLAQMGNRWTGEKWSSKFFPDYYVIPMSLDKDNDAQKPSIWIDYFKRSGVLVKELKERLATIKGLGHWHVFKPNCLYASHIL